MMRNTLPPLASNDLFGGAFRLKAPPCDKPTSDGQHKTENKKQRHDDSNYDRESVTGSGHMVPRMGPALVKREAVITMVDHNNATPAEATPIVHEPHVRRRAT
jgi:hypothetical protein